jgi:hypothetical protein
MHPLIEQSLWQTRRQFLGRSGLRLGGVALAAAGLGLGPAMADQRRSSVFPGLPTLPHFPAKAKSVIYLHMNGGPSQIDMWDHKPQLSERFDQDLPDSIRQGQRITTMTSGQARLPVAPSKFAFAQHGESGRWVSELMPHTAEVVDELAVIKTVHTNAINHDPACTFVMTAVRCRATEPRLVARLWLGERESFTPAFVVLTPRWTSTAAAQALFTRMWSSGFLPSRYTGVALRSSGDPGSLSPESTGADR